MFEVRLTKQPRRYLQGIPEKLKKGIYACFEKLEKEPFLVVEPLHGPLKGKWKIRIWHLRIIVEIDVDAKRIKVIYIGPRGDSYK